MILPLAQCSLCREAVEAQGPAISEAFVVAILALVAAPYVVAGSVALSVSSEARSWLRNLFGRFRSARVLRRVLG
jgi:hypothetical protein